MRKAVPSPACGRPGTGMRLDGLGRWRLFALAVAGLALAGASEPARPQQGTASPLRLLIWINGDKGYNGLQKVGDAFAAESGVQVVVQHPEGAPDKFGSAAAAGKGPDIFCCHARPQLVHWRKDLQKSWPDWCQKQTGRTYCSVVQAPDNGYSFPRPPRT